MPRINLLPFKAEQRIANARTELMVFAAAVVAVILGLYTWYSGVESEIDELNSKLDVVNRTIGELIKTEKEVKSLEAKTKVVEQKQKIIDTLAARRVGPAKMLDDLANILTQEKKVWLTDVTEKNGVLTIEGGAIEHENVSDFQIALERRSVFFKNVKLQSVKSSTKSKIRTLDWIVTCEANYTSASTGG